MTHFSVIKNGLLPRDQDARDAMAKLKVGDTVEVNIMHFQDAGFRRYAFAVIGRVALAVGVSSEDMRARLLVETGRCRLVRLKDKTIVVVQSMDRLAMTNEDLRKFFSDAKDIIITEIIPTLDPADADQISEMINTGVTVQ